LPAPSPIAVPWFIVTAVAVTPAPTVVTSTCVAPLALDEELLELELVALLELELVELLDAPVEVPLVVELELAEELALVEPPLPVDAALLPELATDALVLLGAPPPDELVDPAPLAALLEVLALLPLLELEATAEGDPSLPHAASAPTTEVKTRVDAERRETRRIRMGAPWVGAPRYRPSASFDGHRRNM